MNLESDIYKDLFYLFSKPQILMSKLIQMKINSDWATNNGPNYGIVNNLGFVYKVL